MDDLRLADDNTGHGRRKYSCRSTGIRKAVGRYFAGHNGSGKSTMWNLHLADRFQIPLINADRMMMSILPEVTRRYESKIDLIRQLQKQGYFVLLLFVGLSNHQLSIARVRTRTVSGGHGVALEKLISRFPRTQHAIKLAASVADASILVDNSSTEAKAFTVCRIQLGSDGVYDCRDELKKMPAAILEWMKKVCPRSGSNPIVP